MTDKIVKFPHKERSVNGILRSEAPRVEKNMKRMDSIINNPESETRKILEAKMIKALFNMDNNEVNRTAGIIEKLDKTGMKSVK